MDIYRLNSASGKRGFTLIEIVVAASIVTLLASGAAMIGYVKARDTAQKNACLGSRRALEAAEQRYFLDKGVHSTSFQDLVDQKYLLSRPACPVKGVYAWQPYAPADPLYQAQVGCSIHTPAGVQETAPIARWGMDEGKGKTTGSGIFAGLIDGAKWVTGKIGSALKFDGKDDIVSIRDNPALDLAGAGTLQAWITTGSSINSFGGIFHKGDATNFSDEAYSLQFWNDKKIRLYVTSPSGVDQYVSTTTVFKPNTTYQIAATWDQTGMKIYVNGKLESTNPVAMAARDSSGNLNIGAQIPNDSGSYGYKGTIDEAAIYGQALSASEISSYYNATK